MKNISAELAEHIAGELTSLAMCWKLTRRDGMVIGFTDHQNDVEFDGVVYSAKGGFSVDKTQSSAEISGDSTEVNCLLNDDFITNSDVLAGLYDYAEIEIFQVNYEEVSQGKMILRSGWFGQVTADGESFSVEMTGLSQRLEKTIGQLYSPMCRTALGSSKCGVDVGAITVTGSVTAVENQSVFSDAARDEVNGEFNFGKLTFTSGLNAGLSMEVKEYRDGEIALVLPMSFTIAVGDGYSLEPGCDKGFETCKARYNNVVNFRGEPHLPGIDQILQTNGTF